MTGLLDVLLAGGLVLLALHIATAREDRNAIVAFVSFGLLVALAWLRLASIDVALTEAAVGSGVTGLLLLRAEARLRDSAAAPAPQRIATAASAGLCAVVAAALAAVVVLYAPVPAPTLASQAAAPLPALGLGNPVTAVLLAYRALDTLLEMVVLAAALLAVWSLAPNAAWRQAPTLAAVEPPPPLVFLARVLPPFGILIGIYVAWVGAAAPGGAFPAGTVIAAMWILAMIAGLAAPPATGDTGLRIVLSAGAGLFILVGIVGALAGAGFLGYPQAFAKPLMVAVEAALTLSIAATLGLILAGPPVPARAR